MQPQTVFNMAGDCNKVGNKYCTNCFLPPNVCLIHARKSKQDRNLTLVNMFTLAAMHQTQQPLLHVDKTFPCWVTLHFQMNQIPNNTTSINYQCMSVYVSLHSFTTVAGICNTQLNSSIFTALHWMPAQTSHEKGVCPSVRPSVHLSVKHVNCDKMEEKSV